MCCVAKIDLLFGLGNYSGHVELQSQIQLQVSTIGLAGFVKRSNKCPDYVIAHENVLPQLPRAINYVRGRDMFLQTQKNEQYIICVIACIRRVCLHLRLLGSNKQEN